MITANASRIDTRAAAEPGRFKVPLFQTLLDRLDTGRRCVVLDLGMAHTQTVALFGRYRCRLDIADVVDGLCGLNAETDPRLQLQAAEALLPTAHPEPADAVLCWDILNYLDRPAIKALMARVAARSRPGTLVHTLIVYAETRMPATAGHFIPQEDNSLLDVAVHHDERPAPRYAPTDLTDCMPGFKLDRAMLLSNGMQEILFRI